MNVEETFIRFRDDMKELIKNNLNAVEGGGGGSEDIDYSNIAFDTEEIVVVTPAEKEAENIITVKRQGTVTKDLGLTLDFTDIIPTGKKIANALVKGGDYQLPYIVNSGGTINYASVLRTYNKSILIGASSTWNNYIWTVSLFLENES